MSTITTNTLGKTAPCARKPRRKGLFGRLVALHAIWAERRRLKGMEAHRLNDLGISRGKAAREADRPAWDAPERWLR